RPFRERLDRNGDLAREVEAGPCRGEQDGQRQDPEQEDGDALDVRPAAEVLPVTADRSIDPRRPLGRLRGEVAAGDHRAGDGAERRPGAYGRHRAGSLPGPPLFQPVESVARLARVDGVPRDPIQARAHALPSTRATSSGTLPASWSGGGLRMAEEEAQL